MKKSTKATLLSALIFPGIGQITIGYKRRGWLFIFFSAASLFLIMKYVMQQAFSIVDDMRASGIMIGTDAVSQRAAEFARFSDNSYMNTLLVVFILGWLISVIDAFILGKKSEK